MNEGDDIGVHVISVWSLYLSVLPSLLSFSSCEAIMEPFCLSLDSHNPKWHIKENWKFLFVNLNVWFGSPQKLQWLVYACSLRINQIFCWEACSFDFSEWFIFLLSVTYCNACELIMQRWNLYFLLSTNIYLSIFKSMYVVEEPNIDWKHWWIDFTTKEDKIILIVPKPQILRNLSIKL